MSKPCPSRMSMHSVMANSGFGTLTIHTAQGVTINIPQEQIRKDGHIKRGVLKHAQELTRENVEYLESKGVQLFVGGKGEF